LVIAEEKMVFKKWDKKSKQKAVCVGNEQRSSSKSDESEVKLTMKETS